MRALICLAFAIVACEEQARDLTLKPGESIPVDSTQQYQVTNNINFFNHTSPVSWGGSVGLTQDWATQDNSDYDLETAGASQGFRWTTQTPAAGLYLHEMNSCVSLSAHCATPPCSGEVWGYVAVGVRIDAPPLSSEEPVAWNEGGPIVVPVWPSFVTRCRLDAPVDSAWYSNHHFYTRVRRGGPGTGYKLRMGWGYGTLEYTSGFVLNVTQALTGGGYGGAARGNDGTHIRHTLSIDTCVVGASYTYERRIGSGAWQAGGFGPDCEMGSYTDLTSSYQYRARYSIGGLTHGPVNGPSAITVPPAPVNCSTQGAGGSRIVECDSVSGCSRYMAARIDSADIWTDSKFEPTPEFTYANTNSEWHIACAHPTSNVPIGPFSVIFD